MRYMIDGEPLEIDSEDISYGEMHDATRALDVVLSAGDVMAIHGVNLWVAFRRKHPELSNVQITDLVRRVKFKVLASVQDEPVPFADGSPETIPETYGSPV